LANIGVRLMLASSTTVVFLTRYSNAVGVLHGCRPSSSVVLCYGCIVAKRCKMG